jgi:hypothetical protein
MYLLFFFRPIKKYTKIPQTLSKRGTDASSFNIICGFFFVTENAKTFVRKTTGGLLLALLIK